MKQKINWKHRVFSDIFNECGGRSEVSGLNIWPVTNRNFHHLLHKSDYPEFWYEKQNIVLCTYAEHELFHNMTIDALILAHNKGLQYVQLMERGVILHKQKKASKGIKPLPKYLQMINEFNY